MSVLIPRRGVPAVVWDNIPRGSAISCPSIEKSLTAAVYSDRVLGQTGTRTVARIAPVLPFDLHV